MPESGDNSGGGHYITKDLACATFVAKDSYWKDQQNFWKVLNKQQGMMDALITNQKFLQESQMKDEERWEERRRQQNMDNAKITAAIVALMGAVTSLIYWYMQTN